MIIFQRYLFLVIFISLSVVPMSGCSVFMAAKQPTAKNIELFKIGTHRDALLAEFGAPLISEENDGRKVEMFVFIQGYSMATKTGRVILHSVADVFTLGLWEIVGIPTELAFNGSKMAFHVRYDESDHVDEVNVLRKK